MKSKRVAQMTACALGACLAQAAMAAYTGTGGVLTADVQMYVPTLFSGAPFPAVINPDADHPDKLFPTNTSGVFTGDMNAPDTFEFIGLPVYAIVDDTGAPWNYADPLFGPLPTRGPGLDEPLFSLMHIGNMMLSLIHQGGGVYVEDAGLFYDVINQANYPLSGMVEFALPPTGPPNYLWYGMDGSSINLLDLPRTAAITIASNDGQWASGWPGATLDKNFFPIPSPATVVLGGLGIAAGSRRRRG